MNRIKNMIGLLAIALFMAGCISIPTGDGGKLKLSKDGVEFEDKEGETSTISVDTDKGGYTYEVDGQVAKVGSDATIPEGFPKDILLPKDGRC